ncbi:MAG: hypothetical protein HQL46_01870 [Gammaproteobacteria bacterium]|nr:hypothetical protein [Gammaproteobacteria bacterium]
MIRFLKTLAFILFIIIGYHYFNESLGFSHAEAIATGIFAMSLVGLFEPYGPDKKNWFGWFLIVISCLLLSRFSELNFWLFIPFSLFIFGIRLAELDFGSGSRSKGYYFAGSGDDSGFGGDCGGGDGGSCGGGGDGGD